MDRWFGSDWHLFHKNILEYEPVSPPNRNEVIIQRYVERVKPDDEFWFLGDLIFGSNALRERMVEEIRKLPGKKFAVEGNHDWRLKAQYLKRCGFLEVYKVCYPLEDRGWLLSHFPLSNGDPRFKGYVGDINRMFEATKATVNVHGHTHSRHSPDPRCVNVAVEVCDFYPIHEDEVAARAAKRREDAPDSHS